jgi:exopolyphosphatase/guanosine-5'-triphosphate,3'-diphosphate pyrophosphatase
VFDVGGGSTEIVVGDGATERITFATSLDIGSVRLTERFIRNDPPTRGEIDALTAVVDGALRALPRATTALAPIGVAGTMTTFASVVLGLPSYDVDRIHRAVLAAEVLESSLEAMARMPTAQRRSLAGMVAARADVIVAGGVIAIAVLRALGAGEVVVSDRGVRWGLARRLARARA